jgi:hypothetical protein
VSREVKELVAVGGDGGGGDGTADGGSDGLAISDAKLGSDPD